MKPIGTIDYYFRLLMDLCTNYNIKEAGLSCARWAKKSCNTYLRESELQVHFKCFSRIFNFKIHHKWIFDLKGKLKIRPQMKNRSKLKRIDWLRHIEIIRLAQK